MPFQWGKVIVGKVEKYNGLLGPVYLCRLLKSTKIADGKSSYMIIVTNVALEVRPMEHVQATRYSQNPPPNFVTTKQNLSFIDFCFTLQLR